MNTHRSVFATTLILATIAFVTGCSLLCADRSQFPRSHPLPETCVVDGVSGGLAWREPGMVHGFVMGCEDADNVWSRFPASPGDDPEQTSPGPACLNMRVFLQWGIERWIGESQLQVTLADGSTVRSSDVWLLTAANKPRRYLPRAAAKPLWLSGDDDRGMQGRDLAVFLPCHIDPQDVASVEIVHDLAMSIVLERTRIVRGMPACGYVAIRNLAPQPTTLVANHDTSYRSGILTVQDPSGEPIDLSRGGGSGCGGIGEAYHEIPAGGWQRLPFFLIRFETQFIFDEPGTYRIAYRWDRHNLQAEAEITVVEPERPEPRYREFLADFEGLNGVFVFGGRFVERCRVLRDTLDPLSEYRDALDMIIDYNDGHTGIYTVLIQSYLWQERARRPDVVAALQRPHRFNRDLWAYLRAAVASGRPTPVDGAVYYDGFRYP